CSTVNGEHTFKVTVTDADVYLVLVVRGDVTFDGRVRALDATRVNQAAVGNSTLTALQIFAADLNYDGNIRAIDATKVKQVAVGNQTYAW
ncbi:MAG: dockerin type I repeat-containing protein, partial [Clostridia bacterium]|nr:dockerin type I repeat-containing protein [Clostridia bacterium]